jgi:hypothetical protein
MRQDEPAIPNQSVPQAGDVRPGWIKLPPESLPKPTYWPAVMAVAIMSILWGIVTSPLVSLGGFILFIASVVGWIGDLWHGHRESTE